MSKEGVLVSHDAQVDGGVAVLLNGGQQSGAIAVPDLPRMEVIFWVQQLLRWEEFKHKKHIYTVGILFWIDAGEEQIRIIHKIYFSGRKSGG